MVFVVAIGISSRGAIVRALRQSAAFTQDVPESSKEAVGAEGSSRGIVTGNGDNHRRLNLSDVVVVETGKRTHNRITGGSSVRKSPPTS